jgi:hypothetical protein
MHVGAATPTACSGPGAADGHHDTRNTGCASGLRCALRQDFVNHVQQGLIGRYVRHRRSTMNVADYALFVEDAKERHAPQLE